MLVSSAQNGHVGDLNQRDSPTLVVSLCSRMLKDRQGASVCLNFIYGHRL